MGQLNSIPITPQDTVLSSHQVNGHETAHIATSGGSNTGSDRTHSSRISAPATGLRQAWGHKISSTGIPGDNTSGLDNSSTNTNQVVPLDTGFTIRQAYRHRASNLATNEYGNDSGYTHSTSVLVHESNHGVYDHRHSPLSLGRNRESLDDGIHSDGSDSDLSFATPPTSPTSPFSPSPLSIVTDDLLLRVFDFACSFTYRTEATSCSNEADTLVSLTHTCQRFRRLALLQSPLWGQTIQPDVDSYDKVKTFLDRSANAPLFFISVGGHRHHTVEQRKVWLLIEQVFHRCTTLCVTLWPFADPRPISRLLLSSNGLITLTIDVMPHQESVDVLGLTPIFRRGTEVSLPQIFPNLTELTVVQSSKNCSVMKPSALEWALSLSTMTALRSLNLLHAIQTPSYVLFTQSPPLHLPPGMFDRIEDITVEGNYFACGELIRQLQARPRRANFKLCWEDSPGWAQPSACDHIREWGYRDMELVRYSVAPCLNTLASSDYDGLSISFDNTASSFKVTAGHSGNAVVCLELIGANHSSASILSLDQGLARALADTRTEMEQSGILSLVESVTIKVDFYSRMADTTWELASLFRRLENVSTLSLSHFAVNHARFFLYPSESSSNVGLNTSIPLPKVTALQIKASAVLVPQCWTSVTSYLEYRARSPPGATKIGNLVVLCDVEETDLGEVAEILKTIRSLSSGCGLAVEVKAPDLANVLFAFTTDEGGQYILQPVFF